MKRLVEFPLEDNGSIVLEVDEQEPTGIPIPRLPGGANDVVTPDKSDQTFEQALSKIGPATDKVITALKTLAQEPDDIEMTFGFNLSAIAGVFIASVSTQANYTVTLHWRKSYAANPQSPAPNQTNS